MPPELELVQQWLGRACSDLHIAETLLEPDSPETAGVCFHSQQAVEKSLKAILVYWDVEFDWSHEIKYLIDRCAEKDPSFDQFRTSAEPLTRYAVRFRYPSDQPDPSIDQARQAVAAAGRIWEFVLKQLPTQTHPRH